MNRRELLKRFGVGTAIVPLVGGVPELQAEAKLIEEPKVELAKTLTSITTEANINGARYGPGRHAITVHIKPEVGPGIRFSATAFVTESSIEYLTFTGLRLTEHAPYSERLHFTIKGICDESVSPAQIMALL